MGKFKDFFAAVNYTNPQIMLTISFYCKLILCITIKFMKKQQPVRDICLHLGWVIWRRVIVKPSEVSWQPTDFDNANLGLFINLSVQYKN